MKKKMALLLVFAMIVTSSITVPFVSFADSTAKEISIYGVENPEETTATETADETAGTTTYTAEYTYTSAWNSTVMLTADKISDIDPTIEVKDSKGEAVNPVEPTPVTPEPEITPTEDPEPTSDTYALVKGEKYSITLKYTFVTESKPESKSLTLKTKAVTEELVAGTEKNITDTLNEEKWYELSIDDKDGDGVVFSLLSAAEAATEKTKIDYIAEIYDGTDRIGDVDWNDEYGMMFECPLILKTGKYYVKVVPTVEATEAVSLKLNAQQIAEANANDDTPTTLTLNDAHELSIYNYENKKEIGSWYRFSPSIERGESQSYEINVSFGTESYGDVNVDVCNENMRVDVDASGIACADRENNKFYKKVNSGEKFYLCLVPSTDVPKLDITVTIKEHECKDCWFVSEDRGDEYEISYGCPCGVEGSLKGTCIIDKVTIDSVTYTGQTLTPNKPVFTLEDWYSEYDIEQPAEGLTEDYYTVTYNKALKYIGSYTATIKFCKELEGLEDIVKTAKVIPIGTTLKSVTAGKKSFTAKWKKQATKTNGYQIQYSTSTKFSSPKTVTISKKTTLYKKVSKLKAKKKYYVRVRTYRTVSGKKYYSNWSDYKKVTTKK